MANLCVLHLYSLQNALCKKYMELVKAEANLANEKFYNNHGFKSKLTWLYYMGENGEPS